MELMMEMTVAVGEPHVVVIACELLLRIVPERLPLRALLPVDAASVVCSVRPSKP